MIFSSYDLILKQLKAPIVLSTRGSGKSSALRRVIHERHRGDAVLVIPFPTMKAMVLDCYHGEYPQDQTPLVVEAKDVLTVVRGRREVPIYVDEWYLLEPGDQRIIESLNFQGAVASR